MIDKELISKIINKRKDMHPDDPRIEQVWEALIQLLGENEEDTIKYFELCDKEDIEWITEVFEDLSEKFKSVEFIECLEKLQNKFKDIDMEVDIDYARRAF